ncbi:helix-turn-helix domain-containing protein [Bacillus benzoevorans]|uniref:Excisionase family DNA binding protein n=1 Tax=Bacillus benzoevorans TaxID=1456 RepID=A0A7X0HWR6_9BACI|nr:helix-turn-helix domain-containing protein [Bacillus benzoevorans]MBB6447036.1 excisionase family DNA binding protein [Bacillus benzoevorans]
MGNKENSYSFEDLIIKIIHEEMLMLRNHLSQMKNPTSKRYITMNEAVSSTGISSSVLRQLTYSRAMPHLKVKGRIIFDENAIKETVSEYKEFGWSDPEDQWAVANVQSEILAFEKNKEDSKMIEDILREIIREELDKFSTDLYAEAKKEKTRYYGRTVLTVKEAAEYFRSSPATIYNLIKEEGMPHFKIQSRSFIVLEEAEAFLWRETAKSYAEKGNIYWQRILQNLDWEEKERNAAYARALKRLEEDF